MVKKLTTMMLVLQLAAPAWAQTSLDAEVWRTFAAQIDAGSRVKLWLRDGQRVSATLIQAAPDHLVIQPRTRVPVSVQHVPYDAIVSLERDDGRGMGAAKAVAIGVAAGAGVFLGILLLIAANID